MLQSRGGGSFGVDGAEEMLHQLLAQRERLLGEIWGEEHQEAAEMADARRRIVESQEDEKAHREAAEEEQSICKRVEDQIARSELSSATYPPSNPAVLCEEIRVARKELGSIRSARASLAQAKAESDRQDLEEWIRAIRDGSQQNQALQANQQMSQAHLKALEAMAASSFGQGQIREAALKGLLQQLKQQEGMTSELRARAEAAQIQLEDSEAEIRHHEAVTSPTSWVSVQIVEHEGLRREREELLAEVQRLKQETSQVQQHLERGRGTLFPDDGLRTNVAQLRIACTAAKSSHQDIVCKPSMLEADVAQLMTELMQEQRSASDLEELQSSIHSASRHLRSGVDIHVSQLNLELASSANDQMAMEQLTEEEESLAFHLAESDAVCEHLRSEAAARDEQFLTIVHGLHQQIASLRLEEEKEQASTQQFLQQRLATHSVGRPPLAGSPFTAEASVPFAGAQRFSPAAQSPHPMVSGSAGTSAPPGPLVDPGRRSEPPLRGTPRGYAPQELSPQPGQRQSPNGITSAHQPYFRELHQGWHPTTGVAEVHRAASQSPRTLTAMPAHQADVDATLPLPARTPGATRFDLGVTFTPGTLLAGSSENSNLFHTHNGSTMYNSHTGSAVHDSSMFQTPLVGQAQRASPMATTMPRGAAGHETLLQPDQGFEAMQRGNASGGSSPPRRARTPPARPPSVPSGQSGVMQGEVLVAGAFASDPLSRQTSEPNFSNQLEPESMPLEAHFANARERRAAFQARIAELKGVIGSSLQGLDEQEYADSQRVNSTRADGLAQREEALMGLQTTAAQELASVMRGGSPPAMSGQFW